MYREGKKKQKTSNLHLNLSIALLTVQLVPRWSWEFAKRDTSDHLTHLLGHRIGSYLYLALMQALTVGSHVPYIHTTVWNHTVDTRVDSSRLE